MERDSISIGLRALSSTKLCIIRSPFLEGINSDHNLQKWSKMVGNVI